MTKKIDNPREALDSEIIMKLEPFFNKLRENFAPNAKCIAVQEHGDYDIYTWRILRYDGLNEPFSMQVLNLADTEEERKAFDNAEKKADMQVVFDDSHPDRGLLMINVLEGEHWRKYGGEERGYGTQAPRETEMRKSLQEYIKQLFGIEGVPHLQYLWADSTAPIQIAWRN